MSSPRPRLHLISETATILGVSRATVYRLIAAGDLAATDAAPTGARAPKTRVSDDAIEKFIAARTRSARKKSA
ncbi:helix-turn-helix transcriptional regulator [Actinomadura rupiterrae]|uniref:helix-turn-helix transcriptional regulator n=1 Tax=Actinomadura rupiterrae TaxID=559627 RepID=UPI0020A5947D|nr:helix-turn-helix domain-containing protein [Actinomadura rupiterrae]MCP2339234.1 excisionase family DNA binding protein [Actinomadura rupiterrae]